MGNRTTQPQASKRLPTALARRAAVKTDSFGARLALFRSYVVTPRGRKFTGSELSMLAGLVRSHVWQIENGARRDGVTGDTIARLAQALGVSMDWLYLGKGPTPTQAMVLRAVARAREGRPAGKRKQARSTRPSRRAARRPAPWRDARHALGPP